MAELATVGRIVHVHGSRGDCQAAIVTHVHGGDDEVVNVGMFDAQGGVFGRSSVRRDERPAHERAVGTWHWPERAVPKQIAADATGALRAVITESLAEESP